jgi:hypothetical protein
MADLFVPFYAVVETTEDPLLRGFGLVEGQCVCDVG